MELAKLKERIAPILKSDAPNVGELIIIWIAGVASYAIVTMIESFYMEGWYEFRFMILRKIPPQEHSWRVKIDHLQGEEFQIDTYPACILGLNLGTTINPTDDPNVIKIKTWEEILNGDKEEDDPNGGCPDQCDTPCS